MVIGYLDIDNWTGISIGAIHWYGKIVIDGTGNDYISIELKRVLSMKEAQLLNKTDKHCSYREGELTHKFDTEQEVLDFALHYFKSNYKGVLFRGDSSCRSAWQRLIYWPDIREFNRLAIQMNKLSDKFIALNGYEGNEQAKVAQLDKKWFSLFQTLTLSCKNSA